MELGQTVQVICEDTGQSHPGIVERISRNNFVEISINPKLPLISFSKSKNDVWIGRSAGLEFTVRDK